MPHWIRHFHHIVTQSVYAQIIVWRNASKELIFEIEDYFKKKIVNIVQNDNKYHAYEIFFLNFFQKARNNMTNFVKN